MHLKNKAEGEGKQPIKRQKTSTGAQPISHSTPQESDAMDIDPPPPKNAHLKGRRRFNADLADMKEACTKIFQISGLRVKNLRPGDDEGSFEFKILKQDLEHVVAVNLLVSDTSEYPGHHSYFAFSQDADTPSYVLEAIENVASGSPCDIRGAVEKLLSNLARALDKGKCTQSQDAEEGTDDDSDDYEAYEELEDFGPSTTGTKNLNLIDLQRDFVDTVASSYRPGLIRFGVDDFAVSVSFPVISLTKDIPARALVAWDRRLLSRSRHFTLLINGWRGTYPILQADGTLNYEAVKNGSAVQFKVGLSKKYKPGKEQAAEAGRNFGLIMEEADDEPLNPKDDSDDFCFADDQVSRLGKEKNNEPEEEEDDGLFEKFSLSNSLESLLDHALLRLIQMRKKFGLGWAGAEALLSQVEKSQTIPEEVFHLQKQALKQADMDETLLAKTYELPDDPLVGQDKTAEINLPLTAFAYLLRRLTLCTRYCLVCHNKINIDFEALKPYVCDSKLCSYQYYSLNRGPSLEYEIRNNPETVDLLVSIAYTAAEEKVIDDPLPKGMGLRVAVPDPKNTVPTTTQPYWGAQAAAAAPPVDHHNPVVCGADGLCDFDDLDIWQMRASIAELINSLPPILDMKKHLEKKVRAGKAKPKLKDMDPSILPAAWSILRWCVASCTAHLEELSIAEDRVRNIDQSWRQFRFSVGAPTAEAKFKTAVTQAQQTDKHAQKFPSLYAFHGSPLKNWHSIIRHGLWAKSVAHGRAYGDGVYLAKDGSVSMGHYAQAARACWRSSSLSPISCVALAEIVNLPSRFVSSNPYFVVKDTDWIICRYLLVKSSHEAADTTPTTKTAGSNIPLVALDPAHPLTLTSGHSTKSNRVEIPMPSYRLDKMVQERSAEFQEEEMDAEDEAVFEAQPQPDVIEIEDPRPPARCGSLLEPSDANRSRDANDWRHNQEWVSECVEHLLPPPVDATPSATMALQRELRAMLTEQENADSLRDLGWYMPPEFVGDNLFQWIVELHSFDEALPIAKDLKAKKLQSLVFEIRFPPSFPLSPPFFRILKPRFLPFIHGGGGHITGGGSMCMDLLTSDGWLPSYSISAILLQIKLAISNLDPRPARLAQNYNVAYGIGEALEGYKRAAATHGWKIPQGIERLAR